MANIMIRKGEHGYGFYMPRDIEDSIVSIEFDTPERWGGEIRQTWRYLLHRATDRAIARDLGARQADRRRRMIR